MHKMALFFENSNKNRLSTLVGFHRPVFVYYYSFWKLLILLALKPLFIVAEKRTKRAYFLFQTLWFLLLGAQKYYMPPGARYPSYPLLGSFVEKGTKLFCPSL